MKTKNESSFSKKKKKKKRRDFSAPASPLEISILTTIDTTYSDYTYFLIEFSYHWPMCRLGTFYLSPRFWVKASFGMETRREMRDNASSLRSYVARKIFTIGDD